MSLSSIHWIDLLYALLTLMGIGLLLSLALLVWVVWRVKHIRLPVNADFIDTLRATPISLVILLDLLDFSLDIFSAPISWAILSYLGLKPLRTVTVIKDLIPFTEFLPALTVAWVVARIVPSNVSLNDIIDGKIIHRNLPQP